MANQLRQQIEQISREKNINPEVIIAAIEDAILTASKKYYKGAEDLRSRFNDESGQIEVFAVKQIVEAVEIPETQIGLEEARKLIPEAEIGQEIEFPKPTDVLGRAEALLPRKEQSRAETYQTVDRVRVAITKVLKSAKGPQVVVSRTDPALLIKLFEMEVPEIYDGTVQIKGCVREAGERAKVAVISRERDVDPVGACVGMKGTRVQSIIRELRGEKIDIVEWNDDPATFVVNALSPAKVSRVSILDDEQKIMEVVVEDKQLSLAIGKKGQNVRLAAKIVGWRIDIKSEEEKRQEVEAEMARMARIVDELRSLEAHGVGEKAVQKLIDSGVAGVGHLLEMSDEDLTSLEGIGPKTAEKIREAATAARAEWDARDAAAEAERLEAERLAAEQAAEAERQAAAAAEAPGEAEVAVAAAGPAEGEAAPVPGEESGEGGEADGQR